MRFATRLLPALVLVFFVGSAGAAEQITTNTLEVTQGVGLPPASAAPVSFTQSTDPVTIDALNSVSCNAGGLHADNSYLRRFDLDGDHGVVTPLTVLSIDTGVEVSAGAGGGPQPVTANLYTIASGDALLFGNLALIGSAAFNMPGDGSVDLTVVNIPVVGFVDDPFGKDLVVELFTPDGQAVGHSFFLGSNAAGQIGPTFLASAACGVNEPADVASLGFPTMHWVLTVNGDTVTSTPVEETTWATVKALYR